MANFLLMDFFYVMGSSSIRLADHEQDFVAAACNNTLYVQIRESSLRSILEVNHRISELTLPQTKVFPP